MIWRTILFVGVVTAYQQFNPHDQSDFVDNPDDEMFNDSVPINDIESRMRTGNKIQDEVERLLRQPVIHYEEPPAAKTAEEPSRSTWRPTRSAISSTPSPTTKRSKPTRQSKATGIPHWSDEAPAGHSALGHKHARLRQRTTEAVYSVRVAHWDDQHQNIKNMRPGVIESLVGAHDIVRFETRPSPMRHYRPAHAPETWTTHGPILTDSRTPDDSTAYNVERTTHTDKARTANNATWTAYNEGGVRASAARITAPGWRRQGLVTLPAYLVSTSTRPSRPTPTWTLLSQHYRYTRRTRRHPNCTDSYYQCLDYCFDRRGYKVNCPWYTKPTRAEPARMNFTGLFWAIQKEARMTEYDTSDIFRSWKNQLINKGYRTCRTFTERTTTTAKIYPIYYDDVMSPGTGTIMAKCWVCGLRGSGIPHNSNCYDNFANTGSGSALMEKSTYRKYCRWMEEVPMWFNRSDPFSVWGPWTGGCSYRWLDLSGLYAQRACRSTSIPAEGEHYLSRRMAMLELALRGEKDGCVVSPMASLVPFTRAVSLYARFHVCVCSGNWCNRAGRRDPPTAQFFIYYVIIRLMRSQLAH